jgi:predicted transcriptional regulator of viral defense system
MGVFGTIMNIEEVIENIVKSNKGYVTRKEIDRRKIPSIYLSRAVKKLNLKQVARGFYAELEWIEDPYIIFQYTYPRFIYSFNSAIFLFNLGDKMPNYLEVTGPFNYRPMANGKSGVITHTDTVDESYNLGITVVKTSLGNTVRVYDKEKTICDLIKFKDRIEFEVYAKALNKYAKSKDKDINKLMDYARIMKIENKVRSQMEIILNGD